MHILLICICIMKHHLCRPGTICAGKAFFLLMSKSERLLSNDQRYRKHLKILAQWLAIYSLVLFPTKGRASTELDRERSDLELLIT